MGIKLVEEVMDWCPDDVTPAQRWGLTVLARDANDATRETWHGPEHPEILRRVRMTPKKWEALRSALLKRGLIEPVSGGYRGKAVRYRIASMFAPCFIQDWRKTPLEKGAFGGYGPRPEQKDPLTAGVFEGERPPSNGGQSAERPPEKGGPTPPSPSSSISPPLVSVPPAPADPPVPPAASSDERETIAALDKPTAAQRAVRTAGVVQPSEEPAFITWLTDRYKPRSPAWWRTAAPDLPEHAETWRAQLAPAAHTAAGPGLPPPCPRCEADNPAARFNPNHRIHQGAPCPACHPDAAPAAA
jgi:hypothetical protein